MLCSHWTSPIIWAISPVSGPLPSLRIMIISCPPRWIPLLVFGRRPLFLLLFYCPIICLMSHAVLGIPKTTFFSLAIVIIPFVCGSLVLSMFHSCCPFDILAKPFDSILFLLIISPLWLFILKATIWLLVLFLDIFISSISKRVSTSFKLMIAKRYEYGELMWLSRVLLIWNSLLRVCCWSLLLLIILCISINSVNMYVFCVLLMML